MVNKSLFDTKVEESGLKYDFLASKLDISAAALIKKRKGQIPFKVCEINSLTSLLRLTARERDDIFGLKSSK